MTCAPSIHIGRPKADIDWNKVNKLLEAGCSGAEIAANFGINPATLYDRCQTDNGKMFSEYSQEKQSKGDSLLRKAQFDKALSGDNTMLVWLGKNRLNQRENKEEPKHNEEQAKQNDALIKTIGALVNQSSARKDA